MIVPNNNIFVPVKQQKMYKNINIVLYNWRSFLYNTYGGELNELFD